MEMRTLYAPSVARVEEPLLPAVQRANPWPALALFLAFFGWMLLKQRWALAALGLPPGPYMTFATVGSLLAVLPWALAVTGRRRLGLLLLLDALFTLLVYSDILYYRQFGDLTSVATLRFAAQLTTVGDSVTALMKAQDLKLWADLPVLAVLLCLPGALRNVLAGAKQRTRHLAVVALTGVAMVAGFVRFDPYMDHKYYGHSMYGSRLGLLNYHAMDTGAYVARMVRRVAPAGGALAEVNAWMAPRRAEAAAPSSMAGAARGKNVIVVQVESLQNFVVGLRVGNQEVAPNLNRLAKQSLYFPDFYSQTGQGVTSDADLLANCSLFPTRTGAVYYDYAANDFRCMPTLLREHGYHAYAAQGMPADFWNLGAIYPRVGFEQYFSAKDHDMSEKIGIGLSDESFLRQSVDRLKRLPKPYYAFLVTLSSHGPFDFEGIPHELNLGALEGTQAGQYLHAVHYTDKALGLFMARLEQEGILDDAVVVLYGDHGGIFRHNAGMVDLLQIPESDVLRWTQVEKGVPLMVRLPKGHHRGVWPQPAGQADIAPSLAALLGIPTDSVWFMGRNVFAKPDGPVAFYDGSATDATHLLIGGACFERATGQTVDLGVCDSLAGKAAQQLEISRSVVERNLVPLLTGRRTAVR